MRNNPERVAWTVLLAAFVTFCILAVSIPLGVRTYLLTAARDQDTELQRIAGTILVRKAQGGEPSGITDEATLSPGDQVILDATARAGLDLFDRSHVTLYSNTAVELVQVQAPQFEMSNRPNRIVLNVNVGLLRVGVALPRGRDTSFEILTPHTSLLLAEGSYRIEVSNQATQVTVLRGQAQIGPEDAPVMLQQGMRSRVDLTGLPAEPMPAAQNLIVNGDFQQPLSTGWLTSTVVLTSSVQPGHIEQVEGEGRQAVRLVRREPDDGNHTEVAIHQKLDQDVRDFDRLEISVDLMLIFQSLSGGGLQSSEFPIIVRLNYKDLWGNDQFWTHGFYYQNWTGYAIAPDRWGQPSGEQIPQGVWYPYESGNLMELLGDVLPAQVTGVTIYASGWNYDSLVSEIQLIVE